MMMVFMVSVDYMVFVILKGVWVSLCVFGMVF